MKIDTLNNNGVINMQENHWLEHPPVQNISQIPIQKMQNFKKL